MLKLITHAIFIIIEQRCNDCPIIAASVPVGVIALIVIAIESTI